MKAMHWLVAAGAGMATLIGVAAGAPEPDAVPRRWQFDLSVGTLRAMTIKDGEGMPKSFFYLTYEVANNSGEDRLFAPALELSMDGELSRSGRDVPLEVTKHVLSTLQDSLVVDQIEIVGPLLQGPENKKHGVAIWPISDFDVNEISIFAAGFSGETATVTIPNSKESVVLRKTLHLQYKAVGILDVSTDDPFEVLEKRWIMR